MGERTSHPPGAISWADLATSDAGAAKDFYGGLLGWQSEDMPVPDAPPYSMARVDGKDVAALFQSQDPPHWNVYVTVEDVDDAARRAAEVGGKVLSEPFDVFDAGRMAAIADPTGPVLCLWQPGTNIGAQLVNGVGLLSWADCVTPNHGDAIGFYEPLFSWRFEAMVQDPYYAVIYNGDRSNGGITEGGAAAMWIPYFGVESADAAARATEDAGGGKLVGPVDVPQGRFAYLTDPQGAAFAVSEGAQYDD